jgi:hypothetical protein
MSLKLVHGFSPPKEICREGWFLILNLVLARIIHLPQQIFPAAPLH